MANCRVPAIHLHCECNFLYREATMRINAAAASITFYKQMTATGSDNRSLEKLAAGGSTDRATAVNEAAALQLRSTQTIQGADNPSTVVRISPQAMALSRNADALASAHTPQAPLSSQTSIATPRAAATSSSELARKPLQGLSNQVASAEAINVPPAAVSNTATIARADGSTSIAHNNSASVQEVATQTRTQLISQTGQAQLAQAHAVPSHVLSLLL